MKVSELIDILQKLKNKDGDKDVLALYSWGDAYTYSVESRSIDVDHVISDKDGIFIDSTFY